MAQELFESGKLNKALEIFYDESHFKGISFQQKSHFRFLKGLILFYLNRGEDLTNLGETIYKEGQKHNDNLQTFDGLYSHIWKSLKSFLQKSKSVQLNDIPTLESLIAKIFLEK